MTEAAPAEGEVAMAEDERRGPQGEKFYVGSDHAGFEVKEKLKALLRERGNEVVDLQEEYRERIDFPPVAEKVGRSVASDSGSYGVLVCGTGVGVAMAANKVDGVRAAALYCDAAAEYARRHNNANVITFGQRTMDYADIVRRLEVFFDHEFEGGKYADRNDYLNEIEANNARDSRGEMTDP